MPLPRSFTTVTPFSRLLAVILLVSLPLLAFYLGITYGKSDGTNRQITPSCPSLGSGGSCATQKPCSDEAKQCQDGSYVFREQPSCMFAACPSLKTNGNATTAATLPKNGTTKENQIAMLLSRKTGIPQLDLILTYKNDADNKTTYDGGTYSSKKGAIYGRWIAAKINGNWQVTSLSTGIPLCSDVNPYYYPKELVPACKTDTGDITAR